MFINLIKPFNSNHEFPKRRVHRVIESRRLSHIERIQRFLDRHPELLLNSNFNSEISRCIECGGIRSKEDMISAHYCSTLCAINAMFNHEEVN